MVAGWGYRERLSSPHPPCSSFWWRKRVYLDRMSNACALLFKCVFVMFPVYYIVLFYSVKKCLSRMLLVFLMFVLLTNPFREFCYFTRHVYDLLVSISFTACIYRISQIFTTCKKDVFFSANHCYQIN